MDLNHSTVILQNISLYNMHNNKVQSQKVQNLADLLLPPSPDPDQYIYRIWANIQVLDHFKVSKINIAISHRFWQIFCSLGHKTWTRVDHTS